MDWRDELRAAFPRWGAPDAIDGWPEASAQFRAGDYVRARVVARAPFGVWADIGVGFPALLLVVEMADAKMRTRISFEDYPRIGAVIDAKILRFESGAISLGQDQDDPWESASRFARGTCILGTVTSIASFGMFVELVPGVEGLLRTDGATRSVGDRVDVEVVDVDPELRKVEVRALPARP